MQSDSSFILQKNGDNFSVHRLIHAEKPMD